MVWSDYTESEPLVVMSGRFLPDYTLLQRRFDKVFLIPFVNHLLKEKKEKKVSFCEIAFA